MFDADKTRTIGLAYSVAKKNYDNTLSRFHRIPERNDGQTNEQTDLVYQYRDKKLSTIIARSVGNTCVVTPKSGPASYRYCDILVYNIILLSHIVVGGFAMPVTITTQRTCCTAEVNK